MLTVVEHVYHAFDLSPSYDAYARHTITLGWEDRAHGHGRRITDGGAEFGLSLPRGTVLRAGDCFVLPHERIVIEVIERAEPVFVVEPHSPPEWALFAYHIGNRHQPVMITDRSLVCPDVPGVEQMLQQHRMPYSRATLPFTPTTTVAGHHH